jgi:NAD(P)-dependent dehydrogenase (short-subunit alcohol dehydrogenase family)
VAVRVATALVTGAGTGIGRAIAEKFLGEGWSVVAVGRRPEPLRELEKAHPGKVRAIPCDVANADEVKKLTAHLGSDATFGATLTALVNNAGVYERREFLKTNDNEWLATFETNLLGPVHLTRDLYPLLKKNQGVIINISSTLGLKPVAATSVYSATKAAMINWTQTLALEAGVDRVRVNCICPGIVDTPIHPFHGKPADQEKLAHLQPLGRIGTPEDVAHAVWSLAGPGSEWITGAVLCVDGGIHLV